MEHLHHDLGHLNAASEVIVDLGTAANVRLMDQSSYGNYCAERGYQAIAGYYTQSPVRLRVPNAGHWHVAVDLGGYAGQVSANVRVLVAA